MAAGPPVSAPTVPLQPVMTAQDVNTLLDRAAGATASNDAIIAVVDRGGNILGVRVESGVSPAITGDTEKLVFAIDGAVAEARTGAFFGNDQAPLTSRTIQFISQSTMTQREIQSDPNIPDPNSAARGPGFVAPVGKKAHFPPRVQFTPQVDLFQIEHTNRDSIINPGPNKVRQDTISNSVVVLRRAGDDVALPNRFNVPDPVPLHRPPDRQEALHRCPRIVRQGLGPAPLGPVARDRHAAGRHPALQDPGHPGPGEERHLRGRRHRRVLPRHDRLCHRGELELQRVAVPRPDQARPGARGRVYRLRRGRREFEGRGADQRQ